MNFYYAAVLSCILFAHVAVGQNTPEPVTQGEKQGRVFAEQDEACREFITSLSPEIRSDMQKTYDAYQEYMQKDGLLPEIKQKLMATQFTLLFGMGRIDEAIDKLDKAIQLNPETKVASDLKNALETLNRNKDKIKLKIKQEREFEDHLAASGPQTMLDSALFIDVVEDYLKTNDLLPVVRQNLTSLLAQVLMKSGKMDEGLAKLQEAIDIDPYSPDGMGPELISRKKWVENNKEKYAEFLKQQNKVLEEHKEKILKDAENKEDPSNN